MVPTTWHHAVESTANRVTRRSGGARHRGPLRSIFATIGASLQTLVGGTSLLTNCAKNPG